MVPKEGVEPSRPRGRQILSLVRLPFRHFGIKLFGKIVPTAQIANLFSVFLFVFFSSGAILSGNVIRRSIICENNTFYNDSCRRFSDGLHGFSAGRGAAG